MSLVTNMFVSGVEAVGALRGQDNTSVRRRMARCRSQPLRFGGHGMPPL